MYNDMELRNKKSSKIKTFAVSFDIKPDYFFEKEPILMEFLLEHLWMMTYKTKKNDQNHVTNIQKNRFLLLFGSQLK